MQKLQLYLIRQTRGDPVNVVFFRMTALGLQKKLMRGLVGKLHDLVLDRRTIARTGTLYPAGVKRRTMQILLDDFVGLRSGVGNPAGHLFHVELASVIKIKAENLVFGPSHVLVKRESRRHLISELDLALREIDRTRIEPTGRTRLESSNIEAHFSEAGAQVGVPISHPPPWPAVLAYVQEPA